MLQPKQKDYTSNAYNALKAKVDGFDKTESEFRKALAEDDNYKNNVYNALKAKVDGFDKTQEEFNSLITSSVKKKNNSSSSLPQKELVSQPQTGFSGGIDGTRPFYDSPFKQKKGEINKSTGDQQSSEFDEGTMSWNLKKLKQNNSFIDFNYNKSKELRTVSQEDIEKIKKEVDDEATNSGIWNNLVVGAKKGWNELIGFVADASDDPSVKELQTSTDLLSEQKKIAEKEFEKERLKARKNGKPSPVFTEEDKLNRAKELRIEQKVKSKSESQIRDFLKDLENTNIDNDDNNSRKELSRFNLMKLSSIGEEQKLNLAQQNLIRDKIEGKAKEMKQLESIIVSYTKKGQAIPDDIKNDFQETYNDYQSSVKEGLALYDDFTSRQKDIGSAQDNIDLFKRNYNWLKNFDNNISSSTSDILAGTVGALDYLIEVEQSVLGKNENQKKKQESLREIVKDLQGASESFRKEVMRPISVDDINSSSDLGSWIANTVVANQIPIYLATSTGAGGIALIGASSTGQKYEEMLQEMSNGKTISKTDLLLKPLGYGITETASASIDYMLLKNAGRIIRSSTTAEKELISKGFWDKTKEISSHVLKSATYEGLDEAGTKAAQNLIDGKPIFEGIKDPAAAGAVMGAFLPLGAHTISTGIKAFSKENIIQKQALSLDRLREQLNNEGLSEEAKNVLNEEITKSESKLNDLIKTTIGKVESMSEENYNEIIQIEKDKLQIKKKVKELLKSNLDDSVVEEITNSLKSEYSKLEQNRINILEGRTNLVNDEKSTNLEQNQEVNLPQKNDVKQENIDIETEFNIQERLTEINKNTFGLDDTQSNANAVVMSKIVETMAERSGVTTQEMFNTLNFEKGDQDTLNNLSEKGKALFQIVGKNARLSKDIKNNLSVAREMEKQGKSVPEIRLATGWEKGKDSKWNYEIDDSSVRIKKDEYTRDSLENYLEHDELFKMYPEFRNIEVIANPNIDYEGYAQTDKNRIVFNPDMHSSEKKVLSTILHEVQHYIQEKEGFSRGANEETVRKRIEEKINQNKNSSAFQRIKNKLFGKKGELKNSKSIESILSKDDFDLYQSVVGEVQARNVENRINMTPEERIITPLRDTEDISRDEQIVLFQDKQGAMLAEDGKFIIYALTDPNVSTPLHELAHVYEHYLTLEEKYNVLEAAGHDTWTRDTSEFFARGFEKYLADGTAPNNSMQELFEQFKKWLVDIYEGLKNSEIDIDLNTEMKRIYAEMIGVKTGKKTLEKTLKTSENGKTYNVSFDNGILSFTDENGNETSESTTRRLQERWAEQFDYTQGKTTFEIPNGGLNIQSYEDYVSTVSENPAEIAEALLNLYNSDVLEGIDFRTRIIAENIGNRSINKESFLNYSDINHVTKAIELNYFANKGTGRRLDTLAQELSEQANLEITEQDIVDFILDNPVGVNKFINSVKRDKFEALEKKFRELTGLAPLQRYLQKAIEQQTKKDQWISDYATGMDYLSDENILSLLEEYEQYEATEKTNTIDNSTTQGSTIEDSQISEEQSRVQDESRQDDGRLEKESGIEYDNSDLEDDSELNTQGISGSNQNLRDLLLSENGPVKLLFPFQKHFKRVFAQTFKSNSGLDVQTGEVVRSRNRTMSAFSDQLEFESSQFNKIIKSVKKSFPKEVNDKLLAINDYMSGNKSADISFLSEEQKQQLDYFRGRIDSLSKSVISVLNDKNSSMEEKLKNYDEKSLAHQSISAAIERTNNLISTIDNNMEKYINRSYQIFSDDKYRDNITGDFDKLNKEGKLRIRNAINYLIREEGISQEEATKSVAEYLSEIRRSKSDFPFSSSGNASAPFLKKRKDIPKEFRELLGESKDPIYNYINTVYKLSQYIGNIEYQSKLREHLLNNDIGKIEPELGYVKLTSDGDGWSILNDIYVPVEFKESMDDMQPLKTIESGFYKAWIKIAGMTKINKTILSPTTTARNLLSGVFLGINSGHFFLSNPNAMSVAWSNAWTTKKSQKELFSERQKLLKLGVLGDGSNSGEILAILNDFSKEVDRMVSKNTFEQFFDIAKKAYAFGDDFYKVTGFYIEKNRLMEYGLSELDAEDKAAYRINNGYPTYSYLPKNMQRLRRLPLVGTFVSFPYEAIRSTKNNILIAKEDLDAGRTKLAFQRLSGMLVANASLNGLSALTMAMLGITDDDDDALRDMLPEWQRNSKLIYVGTKNGKPMFIDGTALFPSETIFKPISTLIEKRDGRKFEDSFQEALNELLSPYISKDITFKTLMEIGENKNQFDQKIYLSENLLDGVLNEPEKITNYLMKQVGPGVYNNFSELMRANEIAPKYFGDKFSSYGKEYTNEEALLGLLGMRISTINYNAAMSSFAYQVKDTEQSDKSSVSKLVKTSKVLSKEDIDKIVSDYGKYHTQNYEKMVNIVNSGRKMGMTTEDIRKSLKTSNMANNDVNALIQGRIPDLRPLSPQSIKNYKEKLMINYKGDNILEIKKSFDKNVNLLAKEISEYNKQQRKKRLD